MALGWESLLQATCQSYKTLMNRDLKSTAPRSLCALREGLRNFCARETGWDLFVIKFKTAVSDYSVMTPTSPKKFHDGEEARCSIKP